MEQAGIYSPYYIKEIPLFSVDMYIYWWFLHCVLVFFFIAIIPYTKLFHLFTAPINILFQPEPWSERANWSRGLNIPVLENDTAKNKEGE